MNEENQPRSRSRDEVKLRPAERSSPKPTRTRSLPLSPALVTLDYLLALQNDDDPTQGVGYSSAEESAANHNADNGRGFLQEIFPNRHNRSVRAAQLADDLSRLLDLFCRASPLDG